MKVLVMATVLVATALLNVLAVSLDDELGRPTNRLVSVESKKPLESPFK